MIQPNKELRDRPTLTKEAYLSGGVADTVEQVQRSSNLVLAPMPVKPPREQKMFRLELSLVEKLRKLAFKETNKQNRRVTETELVELALEEFIERYSK
jgi:hypothetical protein